MSDSVRPHRWQPTRLPRPWDFPGKNTGVGYHFLLQCMKVKSESEVTQLCLTLLDPMDCSLPGSSIHGIFQARVLEWGAITFSVKIVCIMLKFKVHFAFDCYVFLILNTWIIYCFTFFMTLDFFEEPYSTSLWNSHILNLSDYFLMVSFKLILETLNCL